MPHQVNIETYAVVDGQRINQHTTVEHLPEGKQTEQIILEKVVDLNDQVVRRELIALGWTPPGGRCAAYNTIRDRVQAVVYGNEPGVVSWRFETTVEETPPFPSDLPPTHERIAVWLDAAVDMVTPKAAT